MFVGHKAMERILARVYTLAHDVLREYDSQGKNLAKAKAALWSNVLGRLGVILRRDFLTHINCRAVYGHDHETVIYGWVPLLHTGHANRARYALEKFLTPLRKEKREMEEKGGRGRGGRGQG